jgi:hypothetical protein
VSLRPSAVLEIVSRFHSILLAPALGRVLRRAQVSLWFELGLGLLAAIAGIVLVANTNSADLGLADTYLLPSIASVIIGGTSIFGGRGGYEGSIIGALILTVLNGLLALVDSPDLVKQILYGALIFSVGGSLYASDRLRVPGCRSRFRRKISQVAERSAAWSGSGFGADNLANDGNGTPIKSVHHRREGQCRLQST